MIYLLFLFISIPIIELALLIEVGRHIGTLPTLVIIVFTGIAGAALARQQGVRTLRQIRAELAAGQIPAGSVVDGVIILVAGAMLLTPGLLTDLVGFLCLVPWSRGVLKEWLRRRFARAVQEGRVHVTRHARRVDEETIFDVRPVRDQSGSSPRADSER